MPTYATGIQHDTMDYFTFTYTRNSNPNGIECSLEVSSDLITWESAEPYLETLAPTVYNSDGTETLRFRDKRPIIASTMRFLRLKIVTQ